SDSINCSSLSTSRDDMMMLGLLDMRKSHEKKGKLRRSCAVYPKATVRHREAGGSVAGLEQGLPARLVGRKVGWGAVEGLHEGEQVALVAFTEAQRVELGLADQRRGWVGVEIDDFRDGGKASVVHEGFATLPVAQ